MSRGTEQWMHMACHEHKEVHPVYISNYTYTVQKTVKELQIECAFRTRHSCCRMELVQYYGDLEPLLKRNYYNPSLECCEKAIEDYVCQSMPLELGDARMSELTEDAKKERERVISEGGRKTREEYRALVQKYGGTIL